MTDFAHPLLDFTDGPYACTEARGLTVFFSEPFADFLLAARNANLTPVVITRPEAWWTFAARYYLDLFGGRSIVRAQEVLVDPLTGGTSDSVSALLTTEAVVGNLPPQEQPEVLQAVASVSVHHTAADGTVLGRLVEVVGRELALCEPAAWGAHEPATLAWDMNAFTQHARLQMPETRTFVTGGGGVLQGLHRAERTRNGVLETFTAVAPIAMLDAPTDMIAERAAQALAAVADAHSMPMFGSVTVVPGWRDGRTPAQGVQLVPMPAAMLVGPRAVRALGANLEELAERFDVSVAGRRRIPSLVAAFSDPNIPPWRQAEELARAFGVDALARAVDASRGAV